MQSHQSHAQCFETSLSHKKQQFTASKIATTSETALPKRLSIYLSSISEPVGFRVQRWRTFGGGLLSADLRTGPVIVRCWSENGQDIYKLLPSREAFCFSFQIRLVQIVPSKVLISISALYKASFPFRTRFQWDLSISAMLHTDSCAYLASKRGDWLLLRQLLADGKVRISDTTAHGDTLLHIAAQSNHYELATELLSAGADVNVANDFGQTPLHKAVKNNGGYEVSRHLLSSGADLSRQDLAGRTPLHCFFNETSRQIIQFHQEDLDSTTQDYRGMNIMHYVSWSKSSRPTDILRCLTDQPPSLASTDQEGRTILHLSLQRGNLELIEFLLDQPDTATFRPDWRGRTLLHYATESRRTQTIDILLRRGFNLHAVDLDGRTVLHHAAAKDKLDAVKRLLELGAASDLVALDKGSRTPLQVAALCDAQAVVQYLQPLCVSQKLEHAAELRRRARDGRRSSWHRAILAEFCKYGCFCGVLVLVVYWVFYRAHTF
ncbi:ankyrin [Mytilinidion resinicola]|uniref:Ankyrin n=1 Tax=Mytilinidion resinicola TaxID=574789 RepID=A0A6A6YHX0_9PEZI|nr:ankyrin [Mytilinidion resinicola]KAF2808391.1 ankyrin [Mytilinidion resinicola]